MPAVKTAGKGKVTLTRAALEQQIAEQRVRLGDAALVGADTTALHAEIKQLEDRLREVVAVIEAVARAESRRVETEDRQQSAALLADMKATVTETVLLAKNIQVGIENLGVLVGQAKAAEQTIRRLLLGMATTRDARDDASTYSLFRLVEVESALIEYGCAPPDKYPGVRDVGEVITRRATAALETATRRLGGGS